MIDTKKFVVAFLAIAVFAGSSALFLSGSIGRPSRTATTATRGPGPGSFISSNAFATQPAPGADGYLGSADSAASPADIDPQNLSQNLGSSIMDNLISANPDGPRDNGDGTQTVTTPDAQAVLSGLGGNAALKDFQTPDWDFEAAQITTRVSSGSSEGDVVQYANALGGIIETRFVKTNLQAMAEASSSGPQDFSTIASNVQAALNDTGGLTVPKDLADFHRSFVRLLVYEKNAAALVQTASDDPLKAMLVLQSENGKYQSAIQEFRDAVQRARQNKSLSLESMRGSLEKNRNGALAAFNGLFGIPEAHAQFFGGIVFDFITEAETTATILEIIWEHLQSILLQMLKNYLVTFLENMLLSFVQNGGNPRFLQGWSSWAAGAFNTAAGSAFGQIIPGLCPGFSGQVTGWLHSAFPAAKVPAYPGTSLNGSAGTKCTLSASVSDVPAFYNDFNAGGFKAFGALIAPNNNPLGAFVQGYDSMLAAAGAQQAAATNKAVAGGGGKGTGYCADYQGLVNHNATGAGKYEPTGPLCDNGEEPHVTTPGVTLNDALGRNLNSSIDLVVNANDWVGLVTVIAGALFQHWISSGFSGLVGTAAPAVSGQPDTSGGLTCQATPSVASASTTITFTATGATGSNITWHISGGGDPSTGSGPSFSTSFAAWGKGNYQALVTVTDANGATTEANCSVTIN